MSRSTRPLKMSEAFKLVKTVGAIVTPAGKHLKITHPLVSQTFTLPYGGSGRPRSPLVCHPNCVSTSKNAMFPEKLLEVLKYLNEIKIQIAEDHEDGRVNSIADESTLIKLLVDKYGEENIEEPPARWWDEDSVSI